MAPTHLRKLVVFFAIAAVGWCALLLPTVQHVRDQEANSFLVVSPTQAVVMIPTFRVGRQCSPAAVIFEALLNAAGSWQVTVTHRRDELVVVAIDEREVTSTVVTGHGGFSGVVDAQTYAVAGGVLCRWTGRTFEPLPRPEAEAVRARMTGRFAAPDGWTARSLQLNREPIERTFTVKGAAFRLRLSNRDGVEEFVLVDESGRSRTVLSLDTRARFVSRESYERDFRK